MLPAGPQLAGSLVIPWQVTALINNGAVLS